VLHCNLVITNSVRRSNLAQAVEYPVMRNSVLLTYYRHRPTDARKHRCRILLAASEPVAYRLVYYISGFTKEFIALVSLASNALPYQLRPDCQSLCQNWCECDDCESIQCWPSYGQNVIFNMAAATVSDLLDTSSHGKNCPGTLFSVYVSNLVRIHSKMVALWPLN